LALSQLRHDYPEVRARNAELIEVGPNVPAGAVRAFHQYLGGRELEFPYLCDPDWTVHTRYGLRHVGLDEVLHPSDSSILEQIARQPAVTPARAETRRLRANPMQQGLFIIDEAGVVRYAYVTTPTGPLPPTAAILAVLDSLTS
jgi:alkyl hydroperoxide reductase subunit AhpC